MVKLKLDLTPKLGPLEVTSYKTISGNLPFTGGVFGLTGRRPQKTFRGKGLEFEKFREFVPGDDAKMIDWKATLKAGKMLVKVYTEEQNKDVIFMFDISSSMLYGSIRKMKCEYAAELIASLAYSLSDSGDNIGLAMFNDQVVKYLRPASGRQQYFKILTDLKNPRHYDGNYDLIMSLSKLARISGRGAVIVIVSDFIGLKQDWETALSTFSSRFEFVGLCIRDPADNKMPVQEETVVISDPFSSQELLIDSQNIAEEYERDNKRMLKRLDTVFKKNNDKFLVLQTDQPYKKAIERFFGEGQA